MTQKMSQNIKIGKCSNSDFISDRLLFVFQFCDSFAAHWCNLLFTLQMIFCMDVEHKCKSDEELKVLGNRDKCVILNLIVNISAVVL